MSFKRAGIFTKVVIIVLLVYAMVTLVRLRARIEEVTVEEQALMQQVADKTAENDKTKHAIENRDDDEVIEDVARDLGLVAQDEEVYYAG